MDSLYEDLAAHGAVMFGSTKCVYSSQSKVDFAAPLERGQLLWVNCDGGPEEHALCVQAGVRMTPSLALGGALFSGMMSEQKIRDILEVPARISDRLAARGAVLYGRDDAWTRRQVQALGKHASKVAYVSCDVNAKACAAAGVTAVPAWSVDGCAPIPGYRPLPALAELAQAESDELRSIGDKARSVVAGK